MSAPLVIAALASGTGSNVAAIVRAMDEGRLNARMAMVFSNNPKAPVLDFAREQGIPVWAKDHRGFAQRADFDRELLAAVRESGADTVVLAGYMRLLSPFFVRAFAGRILNIHPSLLPSFPGAHAGRDALAHGARFTGCTVHFVEEALDSGPIIIQAALPVHGEEHLDALMPRIHALEHLIYPQALQWLAENRLRQEGRLVRLMPKPDQAPSSGAVPLPSFACLFSPPLES